METTPITITRTDLERLECLLETDSIRALPGAGMLREELTRSNVVEPGDIGPDIITMNSTAKFVNERTNTSYQMTLVYPSNAGTPGTVSVIAPVGSALLGMSVGQTINWQVPGGRQLRLSVVDVTNQPEAQKQFHQ
ncbi:nucleoside diphosphate kinase regulator [Woeseia oceani]|uniref:Nucleoside diphosphate kinase regulator n=1 Tax=Woeseia oceani TaxID=1548547 RepID=A0A193LDH0_9GAMM|nr:nucleoside diphosphate kinase regulator [Woeseia oceani]ANO50557.1 nucleoside diphosphate kinase regulator [Woeseia oceani]